MTDDRLRVMVVDDHEVVRQGIRALLNRRPGWSVVAEAGTVAQAVELALHEKPDVIVMDLRLPDGSGVEACREIRAELPETRILMLTSYADDEAVMSSVLAGASAYLLKHTHGEQLVAAVESVARGETMLDAKVMTRVLDQLRGITAGDSKEAQITETEHKILLLIADGKTNREIGAELYFSDKTVKNYVSNILSKLNLRRRTEAAAYIARRTPEAPR
jgi:DNA-binding NarL/FixJ family response regulator